MQKMIAIGTTQKYGHIYYGLYDADMFESPWQIIQKLEKKEIDSDEFDQWAEFELDFFEDSKFQYENTEFRILRRYYNEYIIKFRGGKQYKIIETFNESS